MTNQQGAPEALTLAGAVDHWARVDYGLRGDEMRKAAAELRRLHYENERLAALVEAQQPAAHVQNPAGIEHVAGDVSKNGAEVNTSAQQAGGPSGHIKEPYTLAEIKAKIASNDYSAEMLLQHAMLLLDSASLAASVGEPVAWRYVDARGHFRYVGYKPSRDMAAEYPLLKPIRLYLHPSPSDGMVGGWMPIATAQAAESVTAPSETTPHPACKPDMLVNGGALILALNVLRRAGKHEVAGELEATAQPAPTPQADSQSAPTNTRQIAECYGDCPTDQKTCANPCKFEGRAARAPADSVTAPAGPSKSLPYEPTSAMLIAARERDPALPIETVRAIYWSMWRTAPTPPAQAADSVLEDAARLDWLALAGPVSICLVIDRPHDGEVEVSTDDVTGYGKTLREALDAARKQGATP